MRLRRTRYFAKVSAMSEPAFNRVDPLSRDPVHQDLWESVTMEFAHGRCAWFALAAADEFDLPLYALDDRDSGCIHVLCGLADDRFFDAYGVGTVSEVIRAFTFFAGQRLCSDGALQLRPVSEAWVREHFALEDPDQQAEIDDTLMVCRRLVDALQIVELSAGCSALPR